MFAVASQIEPTQYLNEPLCGEVLGGLGEGGGIDVIAQLSFNFDLYDATTQNKMNIEINNEAFNFDTANLGGLIGARNEENNPVIMSTL